MKRYNIVRLAIITTHPIQYYAPVFKKLAMEIPLKVFYTMGDAPISKFDKGFGKIIDWDLPLLDGYDYEILKNTAKKPGTDHFKGIINPTILNDISDFNPTAILIFGWAYQSHLKVIRFFKGKIPIWFRGDSTLMKNQNFIKKTFRKLVLSWIYSHIDLAFYVGSANKQYFKEFGINEGQLFFAPHAVDNERFSNSRENDVIKLRESLGISDDQIVILFAGKLEPVKNPQLLLDSFLSLNTINVHLIFVGSGMLEAKLKTQCRKTEIKLPYIHFLHFQNQSQMPVIYQACDVFCLPSISETWGLAVNEAMAAGKAILVSNKVGCAIDLVVEQENGLIFESNNIEDLKMKLESMLNAKHMIKAMGIKSKLKIETWNFDAITKAIVNKLKNNGQ